VIGTGRSGSGYIARVLSEAGARCGHESWFNPLDERAPGLLGDSSWCAVPDLDGFAGAVFHQVRHPLDVISSLVKAPDWGPYLDVRARLMRLDDDPLRRAIDTYIDWNLACEQRTRFRWQVEHLTGELVAAIADEARVPVANPHAAVASVPHDFNFHGPGERLGWGQLGDHRRFELYEMADRYGYPVA